MVDFCLSHSSSDCLYSLNAFHHFDWSNQLHICVHALFVVDCFSFLLISNLVPYTLADCQSNSTYLRDVSFTASGTVLRVFRTITIQFKQRVLEISLPFTSHSVLCPVTALKNYFCTVPQLASSPLFVVNHGGSPKPILGHI